MERVTKRDPVSARLSLTLARREVLDEIPSSVSFHLPIFISLSSLLLSSSHPPLLFYSSAQSSPRPPCSRHFLVPVFHLYSSPFTLLSTMASFTFGGKYRLEEEIAMGGCGTSFILQSLFRRHMAPSTRLMPCHLGSHKAQSSPFFPFCPPSTTLRSAVRVNACFRN